jgi:N-acetylmuramic acid 6-phosphate etherase
MRRTRIDYAKLPTERVLAAAARLDEMSAAEIVTLLAREERRSVAAVRSAGAAIARVAEDAAAALAAGGRLIYVGAGTSGRLGALDASECPPTFGTRPSQVVALIAGGPRALRRAVEGAEDDSDEGAAAVSGVRVGRHDVVVGIAASGVTPFVRGALDAARRAGARTALVTCAPQAAREAGAHPHVIIPLEVGPEVLSGSTRLKAGTATKLTLNAISTAAMVRLGKCYGARMVDVKATNAKLEARARRIVMDLLDSDAKDADRLLKDAGGSVKVAVVMGWLGVSRREAEERLTAAHGRLRSVIGPARDVDERPRHGTTQPARRG